MREPEPAVYSPGLRRRNPEGSEAGNGLQRLPGGAAEGRSRWAQRAQTKYDDPVGRIPGGEDAG